MNRYFLVILVLLFNSCEAQKRNSYENQILECRFDAMGIEAYKFQEAWKDFELSIAEQGLIENNKPEDYKHLLTRLATKNLPTDIDYSLFRRPDIILTNDDPRFKKCMENVNSSVSDIEKETLLRFQLIMEEMIAGTTSYETAQKLLDLLEESDYELRLYQYAIAALVTEIDSNSGIQQKLPNPQLSNDYNKQACIDMTVQLNKNIEIILDGIKIHINQLGKSLRNLITTNNEVCISLSCSSQANYSRYVAVTNEMNLVHSQTRENDAQHRYESTFDDLNDD